MRISSLFFSLCLVNCVTAQPLDWDSDATVFGTARDEFQPGLTTTGSNVLHAFCLIDEDSMAVKRSGSGGMAWSSASKVPVPWPGTRLCSADDNVYSYVIAYSTQMSVKQFSRFDHLSNTWPEFPLEIPVGFGSNADRMVMITDRVNEPDDPYINVCWTEGIADGTMNVGFVQSRNQGNSFEVASLVHSTTLVPQAPSGLTIAVTWSGEAEVIHIAVTRDRAGSTPEEVVLFASDNQGATWSDPMTVDSSTYAQHDPSLAAYESTLFLAYSRRSDVTSQRDIYFVYSPDGGETYSDPAVLTDDEADDFDPHVVLDVFNGTFHVFYLSGVVLDEHSTLMLRSGSISTPWVIGDAIEISDSGSVLSSGEYWVTANTAGLAALWTSSFELGDSDVKFDASWRGAGVNDQSSILPVTNELGNCYPNPFNAVTSVPLNLSHSQSVVLEVRNLLGQRVMSVPCGNLPPGDHAIMLDMSGQSSGAYWVWIANAAAPPIHAVLLK